MPFGGSGAQGRFAAVDEGERRQAWLDLVRSFDAAKDEPLQCPACGHSPMQWRWLVGASPILDDRHGEYHIWCDACAAETYVLQRITPENEPPNEAT